jgi:predicted amidohydrolase YtcJ
MSHSVTNRKSRSFRGSGNWMRPAADLIVTRAAVWTGDGSRPEAEAVAVLGDRIITVGSEAEVELWRGRRTQVIDAHGRLLLPGFNDAHVHFIDGGLQLENVDLKDAAAPDEFVRRLRLQAQNTPQGGWILGGGWDEKRWAQSELPSRYWIDPVTPGIPVLVHRCDLHAALANSLALQLAGITSATPDPIGGTIVRDRAGEPTGILKDAAIGYVSRILPPMTAERRLRAVKRACEHAASVGVTSVQHMSPTSADIALYMELVERGEMTTRIYAAPLEIEWAEHGRVGIRHGFGSPMLRLGALKGFTDGSLGSATACFFDPYNDAPDTCGLLTDEMQPLEALLERLLAADEAGMQLCWHAIGDRAVSLTLDLFDEIVRTHGPCERRLRIEHAQHVAPKDFARFARLNVIASVQPYHAIDDGCWAGQRIGAERLKTSYPYRTFLDSQVRLALGTDWYVAPLDPMQTLYAAITRATLDGRNPRGWPPEQRLSITEAVSAYTMGSAYAEFQEKEKGSITPGKLADMVLLSDDIFKLDPARLRDVRIELTIIGGKVVHPAAPQLPSS